MDICPIHWPKSIDIRCVSPKYGHMALCSKLSQLLSNFDKSYIHVFSRLVATSMSTPKHDSEHV